MAQDYQCLDQSNQTNSNMTDIVSSTFAFEYFENGQLCEGNCKQVINTNLWNLNLDLCLYLTNFASHKQQNTTKLVYQRLWHPNDTEKQDAVIEGRKDLKVYK